MYNLEQMMKDDGKERDYWLYVLKCEQDKYYVGVTSKTPERRMWEHKTGRNAAYWTEKYPPIGLAEKEFLGRMTYSQAEEQENKVVRKYMNDLGVNSVRGGDLRDTDEYLVRFRRIFTKDNWEVMTVVVFLGLVIIYMWIDKYLPG